jgi:23S rRNA (uracil1939-C5)-methyltransferase
LKKGDNLKLKIEKYAFEGKGIAKIDKNLVKPSTENDNKNSNYVVFVEGAYPGDEVEAQLRKIKKSYSEAKLAQILKPSEDRVKAKCKFFGTCGGCKQQDLNYQVQTKYKQQQVEEIFKKMGGFSDFIIEDILPSERIFFYRNKMEFSFGDKRWLTAEEISSGDEIERDFALGLHIPGMFDKILDINECFLQSEVSNKIINISRDFFKNKNVPVYSTKTHTGYLRNLVIRESRHTNDLMVNIVTASEDDELMKEYSDILLNQAPKTTTIINNINLKKASVAVGDYEKVFYGSGFIYDSIGRYKFRISANPFFQTNTLQAERLYQTVLDFAEPSGNEVVYDLYSGAGTISIFVSDKVKEVYGFETVESAVNDAEENKKLNNINNVNFITADLYNSFLPLVEENKIPKPNLIILDPPRNGMHINTVNDVISLNPEKLVYVSCNPATQARDVKLFTEAGYKLIKIKPVDMFPHTYHIENVALLVRD